MGEGEGGCMTEGRSEVTTSPYTARVIRVNVDVLIVMTRVECCAVANVSDQDMVCQSVGGHTPLMSTG